MAWLGFGAFYGVTALANPSVLPMFPVFLLLAVLQMRRDGERWLLAGVWRCCNRRRRRVDAVDVHNYRAMHFVGPVRDQLLAGVLGG